MIGNDVVDLADHECGAETLSSRFDARAFTDAERTRIETAPDGSRTRWRHWSAKEAAYKLLRKRDGAIFSPRRFEVELEIDGSARVRHGQACCDVHWVELDDAIHAVALEGAAARSDALHELHRIGSGEAGDPDGPSRAVRRLCRARASRALGVCERDLEIVRCDRVPRLVLRGEPLPLDLSFSHHGHWVAFAWIPETRGAGPTWLQ